MIHEIVARHLGKAGDPNRQVTCKVDVRDGLSQVELAPGQALAVVDWSPVPLMSPEKHESMRKEWFRSVRINNTTLGLDDWLRQNLKHRLVRVTRTETLSSVISVLASSDDQAVEIAQGMKGAISFPERNVPVISVEIVKPEENQP